MGFLSGLTKTLFGGSSSKSSQQQTSDSMGYSLNRSGSSSLSGGTSSGYSSGLTGSSQDVFGGDLFEQLYRDAFGAAGSIDPSIAEGRVQQLFTGGAGFLDSLASGGAGADYLERRLNGDNSEVLNAQIDALGSDLSRFYKNDIMPTIRGSAVAGGSLGGGRQGVAEGVASEGVLREFSTQAANLRAADITNRDNAALGLLNAKNTGAATALGSLPALAGIGGSNPSLDIYSQLAQILGGPTTLTESFGQEMSTQESEQFAQSLAEELGISYDQAHSLMTATGKSSSQNGIFKSLGIPGLG